MKDRLATNWRQKEEIPAQGDEGCPTQTDRTLR